MQFCRVKKIAIHLAFLLGFLSSSYAQLDDLIITEYVDYDGGSGVAIKVCNPTSSTIDLTQYWFQQFRNGATTPSASQQPVQLSGNLAPNACVVIGHSEYFTTCGNSGNTLSIIPAGVNTDDAIAITFGNTSNWVDMINAVGWNGTPTIGGVSNGLFERKVTRLSTNCNRYTNTSGVGPNSWPTNSSTNVTNWTVSASKPKPTNTNHCLSSTSFSFQRFTKNQLLSECDSAYLGGKWRYTSGTYLDTISPITGCLDTVVTTQLTITASPKGTVNAVICQGQSYMFNNQNLTSAGTYYDTLPLMGAGCDSIVQLNLSVSSSFTNFDTVVVCGMGTYTFNNQTLSNNGDYTATYSLASGCDSIVNLNLTFSDFERDTFDIVDCKGKAINAAGLTLIADTIFNDTVSSSTNICGKINRYNVSFNPVPQKTITSTNCEGDIINLGSTSFILKNDTSFSNNLSHSNGCDTLIKYEFIVDQIEANFSETIDSKVVSFNNESINATSYEWQFGNGNFSFFDNPIEMYADTGIYSVLLIAESAIGCIDSLRKDIILIPFPFRETLYVPNVFTPNGDGNNDYFEVKHNGIFDFNIQIYNRWGELLYESKDLDFRWNGEYKGTIVSSGSYVYVIRGEYNKKGTLTILR